MVVKQKVAILTSDAQTDERFESGDSIRLQQIRSAMCAPLWSGSSVFGVIYIDSPMHAGSFTDQDLDLLTALANFAAVAIERARLHEKVVEEKRIRGRLERYHSPQVVEEIITEATASGDLKAVRVKVVTILFADIVGFSGWSEKMSADVLSKLLTEFFTLSSDAVFACGGTIDKFIGDAVMAFFGAPLEQPDHAARAVAAALKIREGMAEWNKERTARGDPAARGANRRQHRRGDRRRHRLRAACRLHGPRQCGQRRGAARGVRRAARRHRRRAGHLPGRARSASRSRSSGSSR